MGKPASNTTRGGSATLYRPPAAVRGLSVDDDPVASKKEAAMFAKMKFPDSFSTKAQMSKVNLDVLRPWISKKVEQYVGFEDDIVVNMAMAELEKSDVPDPRRMQVTLTGFLERNAGAFMAELWELILSAQDNYKVEDGKPVKGMPALLVKEKEEEIARMNAELQMRARRIQEEQERARQREAERERERERERQREADRERERNLRRMLEERQDVVKRSKEEQGVERGTDEGAREKERSNRERDRERDRDRSRERDRDRSRERDRSRDRRRRSRSRSSSRGRERVRERRRSGSRDHHRRDRERRKSRSRDRSRGGRSKRSRSRKRSNKSRESPPKGKEPRPEKRLSPEGGEPKTVSES